MNPESVFSADLTTNSVWGLVTFGVIVFIGLGTLMLAVNLFLSLGHFEQPDRVSLKNLPDADKLPLISILIPARNEALRIIPCLDSLCAQDYPNREIIVLDDESSDGTGEIVSRYADRGVRCVKGQPMPQGWTGKCWAVHQLSQLAQGDCMLFTDADTVHKPDTLLRAWHTLHREKADFVSLWPHQICVTWAEAFVVPMIYVLILMLRPHWLERHLRFAALGAANGQYILLRRSAYNEVNGHFAVKDHLVEDIALSRVFLEWRKKVINLDGSDAVECRMYENFSQVWQGFSKNLRAAFDNEPFLYFFFGVLVTCFLLLPFFLIGAIFFRGYEPEAMAALAISMLIIVCRMMMSLRFDTPVWAAFLHPFSTILTLAIGINSWVKLATSGVVWKDRNYKL